MMPLGLTASELRQYHARLFLPHDFTVDVDVLYLDERPKGRLDAEFIDGQVNIQPDSAAISRTATFTIHDPTHSLSLDPESPWEGAVYFDRMVRVRHTVLMPWGPVTAVPFVGPMTKLSREGSTLTIECQDKAVLAIEGRPPMRRKKGTKAVAAIHDFMWATGERNFRFQVSDEIRKKRLDQDYSVGWSASPWSVCQKIASKLGCQLVYACDGALLLREAPSTVALWYDATDLTTGLKIDFDASSVRNHVRVTGQIPAKPKQKKKAKKFTETATPRSKHPMSPKNPNFQRNGAPLWRPLLIEDTSIKKHGEAERRAESELARALPVEVKAAWDALPVFHLDKGDLIGVHTDAGDFKAPLREGSLPLGIGGDASMGRAKRVSKPRRTGRRAQ